jgi:flagellar hook assembly protein FlgD
LQNYPNPFNPTTTICYQLTNDSKVNLKVYNLLGQEVATLLDGEKQAGYHQEVFNAARCASGMYVYRIVYTNASGKQSSDRKTMLLVK